MQAPDYRKDLDLYIVSPEGKYVSCCIAWFDRQNRMGTLEPVAAHPDFRRMGLTREVVMEGLRRLATLGARTARMQSSLPFYKALGFRRRFLLGCAWTRR